MDVKWKDDENETVCIPNIDIYHFIASAANTLGLNDIALQYIRLRKLKSGDVRVYLTGKKNKWFYGGKKNLILLSF